MAGVGTTRRGTLPADLTDARSRTRSFTALPWRLAVYFALVAAYVFFHPPGRMWSLARETLAHVELSIPWHEAAYVTNVVDAVAALALVVLASAAAWRLARSFDCLSGERWLVFGIAALALMVVPAAALGEIASLTGTTLMRPPLGLVLSAIPALGVLWRVLHARREASRAPCAHRDTGRALPRPSPAGLTFVLLAAALVAFALMLAISLAHPPNGYEALMYHAPLAATVWKAGNLTAYLDASPTNVTLAHPLAVELWCGILLWIGGERLADLGQLPFAALGAASVYALARRSGVLHRAAQVAAAAFLLLPMTIVQSGMQHDDLSGAAIIMAPLALAAVGSANWSAARAVAVGAGLGLAVTTKVALLPQAAAVWLWVAYVLLAPARARGASKKDEATSTTPEHDGENTVSTGAAEGLKVLAIAVLAFLVVVSPWWTRNLVRYSNPVYPADIPIIGLGRSEAGMTPKDHEYVSSRAAWSLYPLQERHSDRSAFGALFVAFALPGFLVAMRRARSRAVVLQALNLAISLPVWWLMTRHEPRFLVATFGPMFAFVPWALLALPRRQRTVGNALLAVAGAYSALVTVGQALSPLAKQPTERLAYYEHVWGVDPAAIELADHGEPILLHTSFASTTYPALYPLMGRSLSTQVLTIDGEYPTEEILARMRRHGVHHAYVSVGPDPDAEATVAKMYPASHFEVAHASTVTDGRRAGTRRYLVRLREF